MNKHVRGAVLVTINVIILYFFITWIMRNIVFEDLKTAFSLISFKSILIVFAINILTLVFYSMRLSTILGKGFVPSFFLVNLGFGLNAILPLRSGELAKLFYAKKFFNIPAAQMLVSTFIEKILDIFFVVILFSIFISLKVQDYVTVKTLVTVALVGSGALVSAFVARKTLQSLRNSKWLKTRWGDFLVSASQYSKGHNIKDLVCLSGLVWLSNLIAVYVTFSVILPVDFSLLDAIGLIIVLIFSVAIPATPAGIGIFEAGITYYLVNTLQIEAEFALMVAILFHLAVLLPQVVITLIAFSSWKLLGAKIEV